MRYTKKYSYHWSGPIAYSVGLIASDGCLQKDGRHVDLTSKDITQLQNFSRALQKDLKISCKLNGLKQKSYRVQFSDVAYYDFLLKAGLTPKKSHSLAKLAVPEEYYADFLRGVFDGDGTVYGYQDIRWPNSHMYYIGFCSASPLFLDYIYQMNRVLLGVRGGSKRKSKNAEILTYAKQDTFLLYTAMYADAGEYFLERKRQKLEGFITRGKSGTIVQS